VTIALLSVTAFFWLFAARQWYQPTIIRRLHNVYGAFGAYRAGVLSESNKVVDGRFVLQTESLALEIPGAITILESSYQQQKQLATFHFPQLLAIRDGFLSDKDGTQGMAGKICAGVNVENASTRRFNGERIMPWVQIQEATDMCFWYKLRTRHGRVNICREGRSGIYTCVSKINHDLGISTVLAKLSEFAIWSPHANIGSLACLERFSRLFVGGDHNIRLVGHNLPLLCGIDNIHDCQTSYGNSRESSERFDHWFNVTAPTHTPATLRYFGYALLSVAFFVMAGGLFLFCVGLLYGRWYWSVLACVGGILLCAFAAVLIDHAINLVDASYELLSPVAASFPHGADASLGDTRHTSGNKSAESQWLAVLLRGSQL
jgi:hypothetical protein